MLAIRFVPEVEQDAISGHNWYEDKAIGLGDSFLEMFYASAGFILHNPRMYRKVHGQVRRCLLGKFP